MNQHTKNKKNGKKQNKTNGLALFCPIILQRKKVVMIVMKAAGQCSSPPSCKTIMLFTRHCHNGPAAVHSSNENHHFTNSKKKSLCFVPIVKQNIFKNKDRHQLEAL